MEHPKIESGTFIQCAFIVCLCQWQLVLFRLCVKDNCFLTFGWIETTNVSRGQRQTADTLELFKQWKTNRASIQKTLSAVCGTSSITNRHRHPHAQMKRPTKKKHTHKIEAKVIDFGKETIFATGKMNYDL